MGLNAPSGAGCSLTREAFAPYIKPRLSLNAPGGAGYSLTMDVYRDAIIPNKS